MPAAGQGSVVAPGPGFGLQVDGAPFFPLGWVAPGVCTAADDLTRTHRDSVRAHLALMRRAGANTLIEYARTDGRIVARAVDRQWYNWVNYTFTGRDGALRAGGHPRPAAFVEGMRWLMDQATDGSGPPLHTLVGLQDFIRPGYRAPRGADHPGADDRLSCAAFSRHVERERQRNAAADPLRAARMPAAGCAGQTADRPFWEWTLRYVVHGLRDHPGLLGWLLWDEPEGPSYGHLFGIVAPGAAVRRYTGPESLPTPDLLRYAYFLVQAFEQEGQPPSYARHPIVLDLEAPQAFVSRRFDWSQEGELNPVYSSGPFDRLPPRHGYPVPEGQRYHVPADVLGQEASGRLAHTEARGTAPRFDWYVDQHFVSSNAAALADVVRRDGLWASLVVAGQAQLPSTGGYAARSPLRCAPNDALSTRLLNDRDLVWQLLTPLIDGARGYVYYAWNLLPSAGEGAEQGRRSNRLLGQVREAGLDRLLLAPGDGAGWTVDEIRVEALTNYFRQSPSFVGPAGGYDPGRSAFTRRLRLPPDAYTAGRFGRSPDPAHYGHAVVDGWPVIPRAHRLLRTTYHRDGDAGYLVLSNAFDARLAVTLRFDARRQAPLLHEGVFDLDAGGRFRWSTREAALTYDADGETAVVTLAFEPYEARLLRLTFR